MNWIVDTHLHVYPCHDGGRAIDALWRALSRIRETLALPDACLAGMLAERSDCHFMEDLLSGRVKFSGADWEAEAAGDPGCVRVRRRSCGDELWLFGGRQVVTREKIEVLALTGMGPLADGLSAIDTVDAVLADGAVPVLSWAPGKWFLERGAVIRNLLGRYRPGQLCVGDTSLRPVGWPEPALMVQARSSGFQCLAGSDPLPFVGEEQQLGRYASVLAGALELEHPVQAVRQVLRQTSPTFQLAGSRSGPVEWVGRLAKNEWVRRTARSR